MKVVINNCFGGFGLSDEAEAWLYKRGLDVNDFGTFTNENKLRTQPLLVECVETLGKDVNTSYSELKIIEIPDDVDWGISEYDGIESIHEVHRVWH